MTRLRPGDLLAVCAAVALLVLMTAVDWYGSRTAWAAYTVLDVWLAIAAVLGIGIAVAQASRRSPSVPVALAVATTLFATGGVIGILYRLANPPGSTGNGITTGAWLGLACCVALAAGAWWSLRDESIPGAAAPPVTALPRPGA